MTDNEFILFDRLEKIKSIVNQYGENEFSISFSGGKDSVVLSHLVDEALPENQIPRVYINTGIEYEAMVEFVKELQRDDDRIVIVQPRVPIKPMLENEGYPFKSKGHSEIVDRFQRKGKITSVLQYLGEREDKEPWSSQKSCPKKLKYQFTSDFRIKISDHCCEKLKEEPFKIWKKTNNKPYTMLGIRKEEGGRRDTAKCVAFKGKNMHFQPLVVINEDWENWYIANRNIHLCKLYYPPFNFRRTGCKGCPFAIHLQDELNALEEFFPAERKQCEWIWKPVYDEYRRLNYRLKGDYKNE